MAYLSLEKAFEVIIRRAGGNSNDVLNPIKDAMNKFGYSIIEKEPIQKKDCIHFKCNTCNFEGEQQYKNLIKYKPKCNCVIDNSKKVTTSNDITSIKKYKLLFERSDIILVPEQTYNDKRITSKFEYKCRNCDYSFTMTLDELADHVKKFTGHKGCENCAKNDTQVYLSLDEAFKIIFTRENRDDVIGPITDAMEKFNFSIVQIEPIQTKEKIQYMCNNCKHKGMSSYYTLLRKGNCRKCNGHTGGGTKPTVLNSFQDVLNIPEYKKLFENTNFILSDKNFDTPKTISSTFYFQCKECDYELGPNLLSYITTCLKNNPETKGCVGCKKKNAVKTTDKCKCGNIVKFCIDCGGSGLCEHGMNKYACSMPSCRERNSRYCKHDKIITACKECGKKYFCEHDILKYRCKVCDYEGYMRHIIRSRIYTEFKKHGIRKDDSSIEYLGSTIEHLLNVFIYYYGVNELTNDIHIDHIKPLSKFDIKNESDRKIAFHWTNLQPLNATKNRQKSNTWNDELDEWWHHEVQVKLELYPFNSDGIATKTYKVYMTPSEKFEKFSTFLNSNKELTVVSTVDSFKETLDFVFKCNKCNTTNTLVDSSFANKMCKFEAFDFCKVCYKEKCDKIKFDETKKTILETTGHTLLTCDFGGDRMCTYKCGQCKVVNTSRYFNLKTNLGKCPNCCKNTSKNGITSIAKEVSNLGFNLLTTKDTYTNNKTLLVQCKCEKYPRFVVSLADLKRGRHKCCK